MSDSQKVTEEIFPKDTNKSYALVELVRGKSSMVGKGPDDTVFSFPIVLLIEIVLTLGISLALIVFSIVKQAPLEELANPMVTTDPAKAPWYFMGLQEMLEHMHPTLAGIILPGILVTFLVALPYINPSPEGIGVWFTSNRGKRITAMTSLYTLIVMPAYIILDNTFNLREMLRETAPGWVTQWLLPALIMGILVGLPALFLRFKNASRHEVIMSLFTVMIVATFVFTLSGFLFRGPGFKLYLPWEMPDGYNPWDSL
jgi:hypothetical protein